LDRSAQERNSKLGRYPRRVGNSGMQRRVCEYYPCSTTSSAAAVVCRTFEPRDTTIAAAVCCGCLFGLALEYPLPSQAKAARMSESPARGRLRFGEKHGKLRNHNNPSFVQDPEAHGEWADNADPNLAYFLSQVKQRLTKLGVQAQPTVKFLHYWTKRRRSGWKALPSEYRPVAQTASRSCASS